MSAKAEFEFELEREFHCEMLSPIKEEYTGINNYSAVVKVTFGSTSFMFAGDVEAEAERLMLDRHYDLKADVLKVGHHGSSDSTSDEFLKAVKPVYAVISLAATIHGYRR